MPNKIPESELKAPGCLCKTESGQNYYITSNEPRTKHTLWKATPDGVEKVMTSSSMESINEKIPWRKSGSIT